MKPLLTTDACTMPIAERPLRLAEFDGLFPTAVQRVERRGAAGRPIPRTAEAPTDPGGSL